MLSQREYARHRGMHISSVQEAIRSGRLAKSLAKNARGHWKIRSAEEADREWAANTIAKGSSEVTEYRRDFERERMLRERAKRKVAEQALAVQSGELAPVAEMHAVMVEQYTEVKVKLLAVPSTIRQRMPHLGKADVAAIGEIIEEALEALADAG